MAAQEPRTRSVPTLDGWLLLDTMSPDTALLFESERPKSFARLDRRKQVHPSSVITDRIRALVADFRVSTTSAPAYESWTVGDQQGIIVGVPVFGPPHDPSLYGVQVWVGQSAPPQHPRTVGAMMWDPRTQITYHSHTTETQLLANPDVKYERTSPEVFRHFQDYPREHILGPWVKAVGEGLVGDDETFDDEIELKRSDDALLRIHLTMRAVESDAGWQIRGLIHDISDVRPPTNEVGYSRRTARAVAQVLEGISIGGVGDINFATGIILEWLAAPPGPLSRWTSENAQWDDPGVLMSAIKQVSETSAPASFDTKVSFASDPAGPVPIRAIIRPATTGTQGTGIVQVIPLDHSPHPPVGDSSILAW